MKAEENIVCHSTLLPNGHIIILIINPNTGFVVLQDIIKDTSKNTLLYITKSNYAEEYLTMVGVQQYVENLQSK